MNLYNFNMHVYNAVVKIVKFRFYKQIENSGIVFNEILFAENLVVHSKFYIHICEDQEKTHYIRFKDSKVLLIQLIQIAKKRLQKLELFESELMKVNDSVAYGENNYFNDTEVTAMGIYSIKSLLVLFEERIK